MQVIPRPSTVACLVDSGNKGWSLHLIPKSSILLWGQAEAACSHSESVASVVLGRKADMLGTVLKSSLDSLESQQELSALTARLWMR